MPFELGMDKFLKTFEPVEVRNRLQLRVPQNNLKQVRTDVQRWYQTAAALEQVKPMKSETPRVKPIAETVEKQVNYASGNYYKGDYFNGKRHGKGEYMSATQGTLYRGEWQDDTIHGQGVLYERKPDKSWYMVYTGEFKNGLKDGWGTYRWSDEEFYEGNWVKGKREGRGRQFSADGTIYEGQWLDDVREGYGATREGTNNHHFGEYSLDQKNGKGKYYFTLTGKCLRGVWQRDIPILGDMIQLQHYKPTFPHQYPLPPLGLQDPALVLDDSLNDTAALPDYITPRTSLGGHAHPKPRPTLVEAGDGNKLTDNNVRQGPYDMLQMLKDIEPDIAQVRDDVLAAETGNLLVMVEYLWRSTADASQLLNYSEPDSVPVKRDASEIQPQQPQERASVTSNPDDTLIRKWS